MAFDATVGLFLEEDHSTFNEKILEEINQILQEANAPIHHEPRSWAEILARHPNKKKQRDLGERLGFYGSPKYEDLRTIAAHLETCHKAPSEWPVEVHSEDPNTPLFNSLRAMLGMGTVLLPRDFIEVIPGLAHTKEVFQLVSAHRLKEEAEMILAACGALDTGDPNQDWKNAELDARLASWGIQKVRLADPWVTLGEPLDLCLRLIRVAEDVLWSGCFARTN